MHPGNKAHLARMLQEVSSRDAAGTVPFLEGVYQIGSGVSRRIHLQSLTCKFNISFAVMAKHAFVFSKAKLSLRIVALLHSPLDTFLFL